jgi:hypothetical protein
VAPVALPLDVAEDEAVLDEDVDVAGVDDGVGEDKKKCEDEDEDKDEDDDEDEDDDVDKDEDDEDENEDADALIGVRVARCDDEDNCGLVCGVRTNVDGDVTE